jgi:hypothetical protein
MAGLNLRAVSDLKESPMFALRISVIALLAAASVAHAQTAPSSSSAPAKATAQSSSQNTKKVRPATTAPMDLHAPPLSHVYSRQELQYIMAYDPDAIEDGEVSVKGSKSAVNVPVAPGNQLQAIPWALFHPTQAWRILTPIETP